MKSLTNPDSSYNPLSFTNTSQASVKLFQMQGLDKRVIYDKINGLEDEKRDEKRKSSIFDPNTCLSSMQSLIANESDSNESQLIKWDVAEWGHWRSLKTRHSNTTADIAKQGVVGRGLWRRLKTRHCEGRGHNSRHCKMRCGREGALKKSQDETLQGGDTKACIAKQDIAGRGLWRSVKRRYQGQGGCNCKHCKTRHRGEGVLEDIREVSKWDFARRVRQQEASRIKMRQGESLKWRHYRWDIAIGGNAKTCGLLPETPEFHFWT